MANWFWKFADLFLKTPCGRAGLALYLVLCAAIWLLYDLSPGQEPLQPAEFAGMALVVFIVVWLGVLACERWAKRGTANND